MILLRQPGILFLKARKTAGSSLEIALSAFAGADDIVSPIDSAKRLEGDDEVRNQLGFADARNYGKARHEVLIRPTMRDIRHLLRGQPITKYHNHCAARRARWHLGRRVWDQLEKVSVVRDPWDYMVSSYYWGNRGLSDLPDFERWCLDNRRLMVRSHRQYFIGRRLIIDRFLVYERLAEDLAAMERAHPELDGLAAIFARLTAKKGIRPATGPSVEELFAKAPAADRLIRKCCRFQIERFGYTPPTEKKA